MRIVKIRTHPWNKKNKGVKRAESYNLKFNCIPSNNLWKRTWEEEEKQDGAENSEYKLQTPKKGKSIEYNPYHL